MRLKSVAAIPKLWIVNYLLNMLVVAFKRLGFYQLIFKTVVITNEMQPPSTLNTWNNENLGSKWGTLLVEMHVDSLRLHETTLRCRWSVGKGQLNFSFKLEFKKPWGNNFVTSQILTCGFLWRVLGASHQIYAKKIAESMWHNADDTLLHLLIVDDLVIARLTWRSWHPSNTTLHNAGFTLHIRIHGTSANFWKIVLIGSDLYERLFSKWRGSCLHLAYFFGCSDTITLLSE